MAHIYKRGKVYWIKYSAAGKVVRKSLKVTTKPPAERLLLEYQVREAKQVHNSRLLVTRKPIAVVFDEYIQNRVSSEGTKEWYLWAKDCFMEFCKKEGLTNLLDISISDIEQFYQGRKKGLYLTPEAQIRRDQRKKPPKSTPGAARSNLRAVKYVFNYGVKKGYIEENPALIVKLDPTPKKIFRDLSFEEVEKIFDTALKYAPEYFTILATAYYTGFRKGELVYLRPEEVDLKRNIVSVVSKPENLIKDRQERRVPLAKKLKTILEPEVLRARRERSEWLFATKEGKPRANHLNERIVRIGKLAGVDTEGLSIKVFRETFGSHLRRKGVDLALISEYMGHSSVEVTRNHYAHIEIEKTHDQVDLL